MAEPLRLALVGLGARSRVWARLITESHDAELAAGVDPDEAARARFAAAHPGVSCHATLAPALDGADAVVLVTPPQDRAAQLAPLFAAHLPVLAEKPLADTLAEAAAITREAAEAGVPLSIGLNFRYLPVTQAYRALLAERRFGAPGFGHMAYWRNRNPDTPGLNRYPKTMRHPMLLEQSIHHLDLIRFVHGAAIETIACRTWNPGWSPYAHHANVACQMTLSDGAEVGYLGTWAGGWNQLRFHWRTDCERGVVVQQALFGDLATAGADDAALTQVALPQGEPFLDDTRALLAQFLAALRGEAELPCPAEDHLQSLAACFAAIEASETGSRIDMRHFLRAAGVA
jgi:myo-inositol 2-dehydrogenase / D-chiro-inositol 1-dehydrogenase